MTIEFLDMIGILLKILLMTISIQPRTQPTFLLFGKQSMSKIPLNHRCGNRGLVLLLLLFSQITSLTTVGVLTHCLREIHQS